MHEVTLDWGPTEGFTTKSGECAHVDPRAVRTHGWRERDTLISLQKKRGPEANCSVHGSSKRAAPERAPLTAVRAPQKVCSPLLHPSCWPQICCCLILSRVPVLDLRRRDCCDHRSHAEGL